MSEKTRNQRIIGVRGRLTLLALLMIVSMAVSVTALIAPIEGNPGGSNPQKESNALKQPKPGETPLRAVRPPIDFITTAGTETATFAMG